MTVHPITITVVRSILLHQTLTLYPGWSYIRGPSKWDAPSESRYCLISGKLLHVTSLWIIVWCEYFVPILVESHYPIINLLIYLSEQMLLCWPALMKFSFQGDEERETTLFSVGRPPFRVNPFSNFGAKFSLLIPFVSGAHIVSELGRFGGIGGQNLLHSLLAMSLKCVF